MNGKRKIENTLPVVARAVVPRWLVPYRERIRTASSLGDGVKQALFRAGLAEMVERLRPTVVLCYGRLPDEWRPSDVEIVTYPTRWDGIRKARKDREESEKVIR